MRKRQILQWWPIGVLLILGGIGVLDVTGRLGHVVGWFVMSRPPDFWSASAAWVAVAVAIVTVFVAGRYAKQQVDKAQEQIREARTARLAQEDQARKALKTQIRIAEEQAQPVVVIYSELNPEVMQFVEIVIKNFGSTPAYNVKVTIDPVLKASPNLVSDGKLADVPIPKLPILAPGQEWRTGWDYSLGRKKYQEKFARLSKPENELSEDDKLDIEYLRSANEYPLEVLESTHKATVTFEDSQHKVHETDAVLDCLLHEGTTRVTIKTIHNLVQLLDKTLPAQNAALARIAAELRDLGAEHEGVWVYGSNDHDEREFRKRAAEEKARRKQQFHDELNRATDHGRQDESTAE